MDNNNDDDAWIEQASKEIMSHVNFRSLHEDVPEVAALWEETDDYEIWISPVLEFGQEGVVIVRWKR